MSEPTPALAIGKMMVIAGLSIAMIGVLFLFSDKLPFLKNLGRLPGDIAIEKENVRFYFPWVTSILLSVGISLAFWLFNRYGR
jgi:hypothetical protein